MRNELSPAVLKKLSEVISDEYSHRELTHLFEERKFNQIEREGNKYIRVYNTFAYSINQKQSTDKVFSTLYDAINPARFDSQEHCDEVTYKINTALAYDGLKIYWKNGKKRYDSSSKADSVTEAQSRANELKALIHQRNLHSELLRYCKPELLEHNYFHAVLEATKSILSRVRNLTGLEHDGAKLIQTAFSTTNPHIKINNLITESETSEQIGFSNLIMGIISMFRNPTAHSPKIEWEITLEDAIEILTILSFVHRRLDGCSNSFHE